MAFDSDEPRDLLARRAIELFAARGYAAVGVQEIVDAAGVTKPTLYHHFGSKLGLLRAILQEEFAVMAARVSAAAGYRGDLSGTLKAVAGAYFTYLDEQPGFYRLLLLLWFCPPDSEAGGVSANLFHLQQAILERLFQDAARDHGNMKGRHRAYAATFLGMVNTYVGLRLNGHLRLDRNVIERAVHQFMHGILS
jgi:TetR/AcrR family transcriptional regulator